MLQVLPFEAEHAMNMNVQLNQQTEAEYTSPETWYALEKEDSYTLLRNDTPIACFGFIEVWHGRCVAWTQISADAGKHMTTVHRVAAYLLDNAPCPRVESYVRADFPAAHRWMSMLGFVRESGRMAQFFPDGSDAYLYARVQACRTH